MNINMRTAYTLLLTSIFLLTACGEDRTGEYLAKTEKDQWIEAQMKEYYLWYEQMPVLEEEHYFYTPEEFFPKLLAPNDPFSYIKMLDNAPEADSRLMYIHPESTYGLEYSLQTDPTGTTNKMYARALLVLPESPAHRAGVRRGDWIGAINGHEITTSNSHQLESGQGTNLTIQYLKNEIVEGEERTVWDETRTKQVPIEPSRPMENNPVFHQSIFETTQGKVGYLVYNEFNIGPKEDDASDQTYLQQLKQVSEHFQGVDHLILDLRYNNGGYLLCAQELAYILAPAGALGKEFVHLEANNKHPELNSAYPLESLVGSTNLDLPDLYVLTGLYTASASECIINGLRPYMDVHVVGVKTIGKNVAATQIDSPYNFILFPITATVYNSQGFADYAEGLQPNYHLDELQYLNWAELGDPNELLLSNTLSLITTGQAPDADIVDTPSTPATTRAPAEGSLLKRRRPALVVVP